VRLSEEAIRSAPYQIPGVGVLTFDGGAYDLGDSLHVGQIDLFAFGDLDGDGSKDAVTFLSTKGRGPELVISMEAFRNVGGAPVHAASSVIGDRIAIDSVTIDDRIVHLYLITQGPDDAPCCPTLHVHRKIALEGSELRLLPDPGER
jgi:hypothetical protein